MYDVAEPSKSIHKILMSFSQRLKDIGKKAQIIYALLLLPNGFELSNYSCRVLNKIAYSCENNDISLLSKIIKLPTLMVKEIQKENITIQKELLSSPRLFSNAQCTIAKVQFIYTETKGMICVGGAPGKQSES